MCAVGVGAEYVLTKAPEPQQPEEASDVEPPPSPAPSDHGSFTSSISRFRQAPALTPKCWRPLVLSSRSCHGKILNNWDLDHDSKGRSTY